MKNPFLLAVILVLLFAGCTKMNQNTAQWRGKNRDGIYKESGLLKTWPAEGPKMLWETEIIGNGFGSPVVYGNQLFVNGEVDSISYLFAFDLKGNLRWKSPNGPEFKGEGFSAGFPGSRSTPTVYKGMVYAHSGLGRIACFDAKTGKEIWTKHMVKDLGGVCGYFGDSESLLIDGNYLYCLPGGKESNVVCLDRFTGNQVWISNALSDPAAFNSPILITLPERKLFVTVSRNYLMALDAKNGELLWSVKEDSVKFDDEYCNTPVYYNGSIYSVSGVEKGTGAFKLQLSPDGKSVKEIWQNRAIKNLMSGFIVVDNKLYSTTKEKRLVCLDVSTGSVIDSLSNQRGSLIFADNQLYCYNDNGNMFLIGLDGGKMSVEGKFKIEKGTKEPMAHPMIHDGVLYVRHGKAVIAYQIK